MSHSTSILVLSALGPWLVLVLALQGLAGLCGLKARGWRRLLLLEVAAAGLLLMPINGMPIAGWLRAVSPSFSIPLIALLATSVWQREFRRKLFSHADWAAAWAFGAVAGIGLYPMALGLGSFDPYEWGWSFSPLFVASAAVTALLLWKQSRFGIVLLLATAACQLRLLESANYWDYLLDPVYWLASIVALGWQLCARLRQAPAHSPQ